MYLIVFKHAKDPEFVEILKIFSAKSTAESFLSKFNSKSEGKLAYLLERSFDNHKIPPIEYSFKVNDIFRSKDEQGDFIYIKIRRIDKSYVYFFFLKPFYNGIFNLSTFYRSYRNQIEFNIWLKYMEKVEEVPFLDGFYFNWDTGRFDKVVIK